MSAASGHEGLPTFASVQAFAEWAETQDERYELVDGRVVTALVGSTPRHNLLAGRLFRAIGDALDDGPCRVYTGNQLVRTGATASRAPDVVVACGDAPTDRWESDAHYLVEVLSPSSEGTDLREKLREYRALPSVRQYLVLAQDDRRAQLFTRTELGWHETEVTGVIDFAAVALDLDACYDYVDARLPRTEA